ncbi:alpha/beta fold hydrolase [Sphingosinicella terrae]|uniref:alpha/beta fold hydrolase n=1 Tax=Sphingosinicella terrae TaxID=2172047 RepID=UPI0013B392F1|nr:alpha/beta fold hydrolase [Sphingosinicella terrae]
MSRRVSCLAAAVALTAATAMPAASQNIAAEVVIADAPILDDRYPRVTVEFGRGVTGLPDLTYSVVPGFRPLTLDLYLPPASSRSAPSGRPLILYLHGGAWMGGHARHAGAVADFPGFLSAVAAKGYVVASVNYRLSGEAPFPAALHDVKTALRWLRRNARRYRIDRDRVALWGGSAGAQLAALAATSCGVAALTPPGLPPELAAESDCVRGVVSWYGIFDFTTLRPQAAARPSPPTPEAVYLDCGASPCEPSVMSAASPIHHVDPTDPPMLLIHGMQDRLVRYQQSVRMAEALRLAGIPERLLLIPNVDHSFIGDSAAMTAESTRRALGETIAFIDALLQPSTR